ncbi:MAG TPA: TatD family hydrolase, partial [Candidatus Polarisedimenticolaceae bacterium]|nr:TatD family hydrolase [Candidatus Polarisedimenticolaceae bacterium]
TFPSSHSLQDAVTQLPASHLILETDCPFLSPVPYRGKTNEPARVVDIAERVAELRGEKPAEVAAYTAANASRLFGI